MKERNQIKIQFLLFSKLFLKFHNETKSKSNFYPLSIESDVEIPVFVTLWFRVRSRSRGTALLANFDFVHGY